MRTERLPLEFDQFTATGAASNPGPRAEQPEPGKGRTRPRRARTREGTRGVLIQVAPQLSRQLRQLALDCDTTVQALGVEALEGVLRKYRGA